jgi:hypothetical protein
MIQDPFKDFELYAQKMMGAEWYLLYESMVGMATLFEEKLIDEKTIVDLIENKLIEILSKLGIEELHALGTRLAIDISIRGILMDAIQHIEKEKVLNRVHVSKLD